jgi:basic membrane protein A
MAEPIPLAQAGVEAFEAGVERAGKGGSVQIVKTGRWDDVNKAREAALTVIAGGTDVLWHILDTADVGVLTAAQDKKVMAIGLYSDQSDVAPEAVIGSAMGSPGTLIYAAASGELLNGKVNSVGVDYPDGVKMTYGKLPISDEVKAAVDAAVQDLTDGTVQFEVKAKTE